MTRIVPCRIWHLPLLWYWRNYTVPREALGHPHSPWWWMLWWWVTEQRRSIISCMIEEDWRLVGYCSVRSNCDVGMYIGPPELRGQGIGTRAMQRLLAEAYERPLTHLTCGVRRHHVAWMELFRFRTSGPPVLDEGVLRQPMHMHFWR